MRSLPEFLCIGAQKSATSWLFNMLQQHPNIWMSPIRELHFFNRVNTTNQRLRKRHVQLARRATRMSQAEEQTADQAWADYLARIASHEKMSTEWYNDVFSWPVAEDTVRGDITPAYLEMPKRRIKKAHDLLGDVNIMAIVRRPVDREMSQLRMWATRKSHGLKRPETTEEWMAVYDLMVEREPRGSYSAGIPAWQKVFSSSKFLIVPFADVRDQPKALLARTEEFLGVPHFEGYLAAEEKVHVTKKAVVPQEVIEKAALRLKAEDDYLKQTFGEEFYERTR